jgi:hypothetical protein
MRLRVDVTHIDRLNNTGLRRPSLFQTVSTPKAAMARVAAGAGGLYDGGVARICSRLHVRMTFSFSGRGETPHRR